MVVGLKFTAPSQERCSANAMCLFWHYVVSDNAGMPSSTPTLAPTHRDLSVPHVACPLCQLKLAGAEEGQNERGCVGGPRAFLGGWWRCWQACRPRRGRAQDSAIRPNPWPVPQAVGPQFGLCGPFGPVPMLKGGEYWACEVGGDSGMDF